MSHATPRAIALAVGILGLGAAVGGGLTLNAASPGASAQTPASTAVTAAASPVLPCTRPDEPLNFGAYSLGPRFEGLPLTAAKRVCHVARPGAPPQMRSNAVNYIYGTCKPPMGDGGCAAPIAVQTWPYCERPVLMPTHHNPRSGRVDVRGAPADIFEDGLRLEVYTGNSTVIIYGLDRAQVLRAGRALVKAPVRPSAPVSAGDTSAPLPPPQQPGSVGCG
jgi:hypothetical protein